MNKFLLGAAAATLLLSSCTKNDLIDAPNAGSNDGKVRFSASTGLVTTKAAPGNPFVSTGDLQHHKIFTVKGYVDGKETPSPLVNTNVTFDGVSWEYKDEPYWPNTTMDFYAYANWGGDYGTPAIYGTDHATLPGITATVTIPKTAITNKEDFTHKDLLVAATKGATKEIRTLLTFKHALTQIVFKAGNINPDKIEVKIGGVEIVNVAGTGNMTFPDANGKVAWDIATNPQNVKYAVSGINNTVDGGFEVPNLSATPNEYSKYPRIQTLDFPETDNNALMLIPQRFDAWDPNSGTKAEDAPVGKAYIKLTALITKKGLDPTTSEGADKKYIYAGGVTNGGTQTGEFTYGTVYIPVESQSNQAGEWIAGKRINYIITFGDNNSGSGGGGYDENGDPILVPIRFRAVVEDWVEVDVPLLTATFEAKSTAITHKFIDGYTNQLLNDIKAAPAPKVYTAVIGFEGTTSANIGDDTGTPALDFLNSNDPANVTFQQLLGGGNTYQNAKFRPGSTLTYDLSKVTNLSTNAKEVKIAIPTGWIGTINGAEQTSPVKLTSATPAENILVLTKQPTTGYNYICQIGYIEDNLDAVESNENYTDLPHTFTNTVWVNGPINPTAPGTAKSVFFSSDMLAKITANGYKNATLTIDLTAVKGSGTNGAWAAGDVISTYCPTGWTATKDGAIYYPGDLIAVDDQTTTKTIVFKKGTGTSELRGWKNDLELKDFLAKAEDGDVFYYNNVDGLITVDFNYSDWDVHSDISSGASFTVFFKHNVGEVRNIVGTKAAAAKASGEWRWSNMERSATFTQVDIVNRASSVNYIKYLTKATLLSTATETTNEDEELFVTAAAPAAWDGSWMVTSSALTEGQSFTVNLSDPAVVVPADRFGWSYNPSIQKAIYKAPAVAADVDEIGTELTAAGRWVVTSVADLSALDVTGVSLNEGDKLYILVTGTDVIVKPIADEADWTVTGRVVTYTQP